LGNSFNPAGGIASHTSDNDAYAWGGHYAVNRSYTSNRLNQYTASGSVTPTYDSRGNLTSAGGTPFYTYDSENRLTSSWGQASLSYDPLGRLFQTSGASTTRFGYDGQDMIAEYNSSNALVRRYVFGPGTDEPLVWYEGTGTSTRRWYHADERGSIIATSDSSGAMSAINTYDEHGIPGASNSGRFQYTGQAWLPEIGMYYYRARMYSPTLGRFLQSDPIGYGGGMNLYAYASGDPVNFTDPLGLDPPENEEPPITVTALFNMSNFAAGLGGHGATSSGGGPGALTGGGGGNECDPENCATVTATKQVRRPPPPPPPPLPPGWTYYPGSHNRYMENRDGRIELTPEYAEQACRNYHALMYSNNEVAIIPFELSGITMQLATAFGARFLFIVGGVHIALSFTPPPPGCQ
jgi:RHS repeat-associated protein